MAVWQLDWAAAIPDWFITGRSNVTCQHQSTTEGEWLMTEWLKTPCSRVLLEKQVVPQARNVPHCMEPGSLFPCSQKSNHLSVSWARWILSMPSNPVSLRSMLMFPACLCLGLPSCLFYFPNPVYTGLFEMIVGVLTTCHTQYTWDSSICIFLFNRTTLQFLLRTLQVLCMCTLRDSTNINTIIEFVPNCL